jgi:hypothetical protein
MNAAGSTEAVHGMITAFESHELPRAEWTHRAHLTVATWYVLWYGPDAALDHVREAIQAYNTAHGIVQTPTGGYHETITRFYVWLVSRAVRRAGVSVSMGDLVNGVVSECTDRDIPYRYYSRERLMSVDARQGWIEPDLTPLTRL